MEKDDSNGNSFEIIEKPQSDKSVSESNAPVIVNNTNITTGNLLSNVAPPSNIPDFTIWTSAAVPSNTTPTTTKTSGVVTAAPILVNEFPNTQFSAVIPLSKGIPQEALVKRPPIEAEQVSPGGFFDFVKDALSSQVVSKMVEKAKNSVDSIITTLDPQMSEYMNTSSDIKIAITSEEHDIVSAVRDAAITVFGKASVIGIKNTLTNQRQAVGMENGIKNIEEKIAFSTQLSDGPVIGIESVLIKQGKNWHDVTLLILKDSHNEIKLQTLSQAVPVPVNKFLGPEVADIDVENKLSEYLKAIPCWQEEVSGIQRRDIINLAAKVLLKFYKDSLPQPTAEVQIK
ncbi:protein PRRC1-like isoform X2 [Rhynchophorus ferrugineus]|uniref:protein PRRC1-like isoform X2 n=1 Tax=Rhynchophorus ferrugineus TaxID=354439 RepID=UPI003FCCC4A0